MANVTQTLYRTSNFRKLFTGQLISGLGDWLATFAFIALVYSLTGQATSVAVILILRLVPPMFAAPIGGVLAEKLTRDVDCGRRVLSAACWLLPMNILTQALEANRKAGLPAIDVSPLQGKFLHVLVQMTQAKRVLEIGLLGGYSTIWMARALHRGGRIVSLEFSPQARGCGWRKIEARRFC